ncbi:MAG: hypothetical protein D6730_06850 [Bacteroidetes bacterium]|nr:MAG: hypothetical protein D6730_06850 [Bacteroidota bacterium]
MLISIYGCKKDRLDPDPGPEKGNIEVDSSGSAKAEDFETYAGDIGVEIDVRDLARKAYQPATILVRTTAQRGNHDQEVPVDAFTSLAVLSVPVASLSAEAEAELRDGVGLSIEVKNEQGQSIYTEDFGKTSFKSQANRLVPASSEMENLGTEVAFKEGVPYFLQIVFSDGRYTDNVAMTPRHRNNARVYRWFRSTTADPYFDFSPHKTYAQFYFQKFPNEANTYAIYSAYSKRYLAIDDNDGSLRQSGVYSYTENFHNLHPRYKFRIERSPGLGYTFRDMQGNFLKRKEQSWTTQLRGGPAYFRIISLDIDWEVELIDTRHLAPILPAATTSFGFNSTLKNCASGTLEQEVGIEVSETTTFSTSYEEAIGFAGRVTSTTGASATATAEASFFGNGGSVSGTVETSLEVSVEARKTSTRGQMFSTEQTKTYFSKRRVSVPAGRASLVYDAYQTYSNVQVPFVQKFRIKGKFQRDGSSLTGPEIATQYHFASGSGLIAETGPDYIEIYVRGVSVMDNILDTKSEVKDVPVDCDD